MSYHMIIFFLHSPDLVILVTTRYGLAVQCEGRDKTRQDKIVIFNLLDLDKKSLI